jgi:hypothetical protein
MSEEKKVSYYFAVICVVAIVFVACLIFLFSPKGESFSELYFEEHEKLPSVLRAGEDFHFSFSVVSHEKEPTTYTYNVSFDENDFENGYFSLLPGEKKTIDVSYIPEKPTIVFVLSEATREESKIQIDAGTKKITLIDGNITTLHIPPDTERVIKGGNVLWSGNKITLPLNIILAGGGKLPSLTLDLSSSENYVFTYTTRKNVTDSPVATFYPVENLTGIGYDITTREILVKNDRGDISIVVEEEKSKYRYENKKIEVKVIAEGIEYSIHFWVIVI